MNNTLIKGLAILESLARAQGPMGVTEIATLLQLPKSNVHRMLQGLLEMRYVARDEATGAYKPSMRLWALGSSVLARLDLRQVSEPAMHALVLQTQENVHLAMLDGNELVYMHKMDSPRPERAQAQVGDRGLAHCLAGGKAILAFQPAAELERLARRLKPATRRSIVEPAAFLRELAQVREQGFATNVEGWREGVNGVAAPVRDGLHRVIASIGVSGPSRRLTPNRMRLLGERVVAAAEDISFSLGGGAGSKAMRALSRRMHLLPGTRTVPK